MDDLDRQIAELRAFTGVNPGSSQPTAAPQQQSGDDLDARIATLRAQTGIGPQAAPQQETPGGWDAFALNVGRGMLDAGRGARQLILNSAAAIAPEGAPIQQITADVNRQTSSDRADEARLMRPVEGSHPYASAAGRLVGNAAATAPLAIVAPGGAATAFLPRVGNFAAQGALGATVEPVDTEQSDGYWGEKAKQVVTGAGVGAGVGGGLHVAGHAIGQTLNFPRTIYNRLQQKAMETPYAREGERVAAETGMELTPAMVSGSRAARQAENLAQQSMWSSDIALRKYQQLTDQAEAHASELIDRLSRGRGAQSAAVVGASLRKATTEATDRIFNIADAQWKRDVSEIYRNAPEGFDLSNTRRALESIKEGASLTEIGSIIKSKAAEQVGRLDRAAAQNAANPPMQKLVEMAQDAYDRAAAMWPDQAEAISASLNWSDRKSIQNGLAKFDALERSSATQVLGKRPGGSETLVRAVKRLGGLNLKYAPDVTGDTVKKSTPIGVFTKAGRSPDDMVRALREEGFLFSASLDGVPDFFEKLGSDLSKRTRTVAAHNVATSEARAAWDESAARAAGAVMPERTSGGISPFIGIDQAMSLRRDFSKAAKGTGIIFKDLHPSENRRYAIQLFDAIEKDFDAAANNANGPVGDALKIANANYKRAMESINYIQTSALGKLLGKDVVDSLYSGNTVSTEGLEKLTKSVLRMEPSELTQVRNILGQHAPDVLQDWKAWTLAEAMRKGEALSPSMGSRIRFDPAKAAGGLMRPDQRAALFTAEENRWLGTFDEALRRWSDKFGFNTSWTAPASETMSVLKRTGIGVGAAIPTLASGAMGGAASLASGVPSVWLSASYAMGMREIANAMLNPGDRRQLLSILKSPPGSRLATRGIAHLSSKYANQAAAQSADDGPKQDAAANDYGNGQ